MTEPLRFFVHASNIHNGSFQLYGPFAWPPTLTYENLHSNIEADRHFQIFSWIDPQDQGRMVDDPDNPGEQINEHGYTFWTDQDGETRYDGWRTLREVILSHHPDGSIWTSSVEPYGPFWTDITIELDPSQAMYALPLQSTDRSDTPAPTSRQDGGTHGAWSGT